MKSGRVVEGASADVSELQEREHQIFNPLMPGQNPEPQAIVGLELWTKHSVGQGGSSLQELRSLAEAT